MRVNFGALTDRAGRAWKRLSQTASRREALFRHSGRQVPIRACFVPDLKPLDADIAHADRLLAAYRKAVADSPPPGRDDIWTYNQQFQADYFRLLTANDPRDLAAYLCNMSRHSATHGTIQGAAEYRHLNRSFRYRLFISRLIKERLVNLAEGVGAIPIENPEQGEWASNFAIPAGELSRRIDDAIGIPAVPPEIDGGLFKIVAGDRLYGERDCSAIYTAWLLAGEAGPGASIAEIGGGGGRLAYWAIRLGLKRYTIYDLPHINVLQGFYLLKAGLEVSLYGETGNELRVLPGYCFPSGQYDVAINQDSFPEIDPEIVKSYLRGIATSAGRFISINHESEPLSLGRIRQHSVPKLIRQVGGYHRLSRGLFWLRPGYCYEVYAPLRSA